MQHVALSNHLCPFNDILLTVLAFVKISAIPKRYSCVNGHWYLRR